VDHAPGQRFNQAPLGILQILPVGESVFPNYSVLGGTRRIGGGCGHAMTNGNRGSHDGRHTRLLDIIA
jgi:hypothetical protein